MVAYAAALLSTIRPRNSYHRALLAAMPLLIFSATLPFLRVLVPVAAPPSSSLEQAISLSTESFRFDIAEWEVGALAESALRRAQDTAIVLPVGETERSGLVLRYYERVGKAAQLRRQHDELEARAVRERDGLRLQEIEKTLAATEREVAQLTGVVNVVLSAQIESHLADQGLEIGPLVAKWHLGFPPLTFEVVPPVYFKFARLPLLLVVAPRDKIAVLSTHFLQPAMTVADMSAVEGRVDRANVSSLVLPIGGFAAYPSVIPQDYSLRQSLQTISHEWVHHYLAVRPLGSSYFTDYSLRSINELVADLAGSEVASAVLRTHYVPPSSPSRVPQQTPGYPPESSGASETFDFGRAMASLRVAVEALLSQGDVAGAESLMAERKQWLESKGYYVRKLNTAYLTFYGAYAGSGNPYEPPLRQLRAASSSLGDFLRRVAGIGSERDLLTMAAQAQGGH